VQLVLQSRSLAFALDPIDLATIEVNICGAEIKSITYSLICRFSCLLEFFDLDFQPCAIVEGFVLCIERLVEHIAHEWLDRSRLLTSDTTDNVQLIQNIFDLGHKIRLGCYVKELFYC